MPECSAAQLIMAPPSMSKLVISSCPSDLEKARQVWASVGGGGRNLLDANAVFPESLLALFFGEGADHQDVFATAVHQAGFQGQAKARIDDHSQQRTTPRKPTAIGEQRIICNDRAHTNHDGVALVTQILHVRASDFAGDPSATG